jgi:hypothetical protein
MLQLDSSSTQRAIKNSRNNTPRQQAKSTKPPTTTNHETKNTHLIKTDRCKKICTNKHERISSFVRGESADKWFRNSPDASNPSKCKCSYSTHYHRQNDKGDDTGRSSPCCPPTSTTEGVPLIHRRPMSSLFLFVY